MSAKIVVSAPGKIIFSGDHAVVYGKGAIAASIDLRIKCTIETVEDEDDIVFALEDMGTSKVFRRSELVEIAESLQYNPSLPSSLSEENLEKLKSLISSDGEMSGPADNACLIFLMFYFSIVHVFIHQRSLGLKISVKSELPLACGLGSSASFSVSLSAACLLLVETVQPKSNSVINHDHSDHVLLNDELELISKWAYIAEMLSHGRPSGIDNSVCCFGHALYFKEGQMEKLDRFPLMDVLVINSNVPRSTAQLVGLVRKLHTKMTTILSKIFDTMESITDEMKDILAKLYSATKENMPKDSINQLYTNIEDLLSIHQHLLNSIGVGHKAITEISEICLKFRLVSKATGAGGGGCSFAILPPDYPDAQLSSLISELKEEGYNGWKTKVGCKGVAIETFTS